MGRIAVDVVLLPSDEMMDNAIRANAELVEKFASKIVLNKENCLPHISLAMGCIDERDVAPISRLLPLAAKENPLGELAVIGIRTSTNARGEKVSVFEVEKTKQIQALHEDIIKKVTPYFSRDVTSQMIYGDEEAAETTLQWIKNYRKKAGFENFFPHITIGFGQIESEAFPITFTASKLVLCHLGNHCTCRKILASIDF